MTSFADTAQKTRSNAERGSIGSVCKATATMIVGMILVFSIVHLVRANLARTLDMEPIHQSELRGLLCRIDRRCPSNIDEASK